ncbi:MAG: Nramp family divalent metal transporter, partial [Melioribacteraceae bacterium]|nr:Nramp family divalent metal transporter [Melioribacteraceae bacterium]
MGKITKRNVLKTIGPGILFAGAAIGGSHLIQSTRAGANYGLDLLGIVLLINILKYPFFEFGHRYTAATGESILTGYIKLGRLAVITFIVLNIITAIINAAALTLITAGLSANLFKLNYSMTSLGSLVLIFVLFILFIGRYSLLDKVVKFLIFLLALTTITTVLVALGVDSSANSNNHLTQKELWDAAGIAFLLALMGWMPAPIEASVWPSLWTLERTKQTNHNPSMKEALIDFHIGYIGTTIMALFFVGLGAFVMYGSGESFSNSGLVFSAQLVSLYTKTIGNWSEIIISTIVFVTMMSTMLTVFDAYPRTLAGSLEVLKNSLSFSNKIIFWTSGLAMAIFSIIIIQYFTSGLKTLLDFATILSFLAAPVFALINYKVVTAEF